MLQRFFYLSLLFPSVVFAQQPALISYVNPLIGTARMGHTYPGATVPFGMVQLSPDTDTLMYSVNGQYNKDIYKYCAGYQYDDPTIVGFSHTHFSGTGHSDLGDILVMPASGELQLNPGIADHPESGFRSIYQHSTEIAQPAYYKVFLEDDRILAELTATERTGMHRYTFEKGSDAHIILDLVSGIYNHDQKNVWTFVRVENDTLITGYRQTNGWARTRTVYFAITLSKPISDYGYKSFDDKTTYNGFWRKFTINRNFPEMAAKQLRAYFNFDLKDGESLLMKVGLSSVSTDGALLNLRTENPGWDFDETKAQGQLRWEEELSKIRIETPNESDKINFYTAMYHAFLSPTIYTDVDNRYRGLDQQIHTAEGFTNYTTFSLWDTYRALHPFMNFLEPKRNNDMIRSMLAHYEQSAQNLLPVWSHHANENWCMIGYHSVPVIADAIVTGTATFDRNKALEACISSASADWYEGLGDYRKLGYVPEDVSGSSVSKTLEYAFDDYCIAQMASVLGRTEEQQLFEKRSRNYLNVFDAKTGFMRPRLKNGNFLTEFDVLDTHQKGFIEGNSWNYSLYVPHDPQQLVALGGGRKRFSNHLDSLFTMDLPDKYFEHTEDITRDGIIGCYVHGNEPSHHVAYLYNATGKPWKTQEKVRRIMPLMYRPVIDGLGGNDDCGQMSAWYLFSALGFYPMAPASGFFEIGSPLISKATIHLENGKTLQIIANNQSEKNVYVRKVTFNGKTIDNWKLEVKSLLQGGELIFDMSDKPLK